MPQDIVEIINRKIWTVEEILSRVDEIVEKSKSLSPNQRKKVSTRISDWSEDKVKEHIDSVKDAVINPIRHKNKEKFKGIGVDIEKIPEKVLDSTGLVNSIISLFKDIRNINSKLTNILIEEQFIENGLGNIPDKIEQKLRDIIDAESGIKEIIEKEINKQFKYKLLTEVLEDVSFLEEAEEIILNIDYLTRFGILIEYSLPFEDLYRNLNTLSRKISDVIDNFGILEEEIKQKIEKKVYSEAHKIVEEMEKNCAERKRRLIDELKIYLFILKSLEEDIPEALSDISGLEEKTIPELEEYVRKIKERSLGYLGESGIKLLNFLKGEADFPKGIKINDIKRTLDVLRPIFLKGIEEESSNAGS